MVLSLLTQWHLVTKLFTMVANQMVQTIQLMTIWILNKQKFPIQIPTIQSTVQLTMTKNDVQWGSNIQKPSVVVFGMVWYYNDRDHRYSLSIQNGTTT